MLPLIGVGSWWLCRRKSLHDLLVLLRSEQNVVVISTTIDFLAKIRGDLLIELSPVSSESVMLGAAFVDWRIRLVPIRSRQALRDWVCRDRRRLTHCYNRSQQRQSSHWMKRSFPGARRSVVV